MCFTLASLTVHEAPIFFFFDYFSLDLYNEKKKRDWMHEPKMSTIESLISVCRYLKYSRWVLGKYICIEITFTYTVWMRTTALFLLSSRLSWNKWKKTKNPNVETIRFHFIGGFYFLMCVCRHIVFNVHIC